MKYLQLLHIVARVIIDFLVLLKSAKSERIHNEKSFEGQKGSKEE